MIQHKRNMGPVTKVPTANDLIAGELAIDYPSSTIYVGKDGDAPIRVGGIYDPVTANGDNLRLTGNGTSSGPLSLRLAISANPGNELQVRPNGIGVWESAPANVLHQYVRASGNDSNSGTKSAPLRTVMEALRRAKESSGAFGYFTIWLKAGETFKIDQSMNFGGKTIRFESYEEPKYDNSTNGTWCPNYLPCVAADYQRPTIVMGWYRSPANGMAMRASLDANIIIFSGFVIRLIPNDLPDPEFIDGWWLFNSADMTTFNGCDIYRQGTSTYLGGNRITTVAVNIIDTVGGGLSAGTVSWFNWDPPVATCPGLPSYSMKAMNITSFVKYTNISSWATFDVPYRKAFGITQNWNIFA